VSVVATAGYTCSSTASPLAAITSIDPHVITAGKPQNITISHDAITENSQLYFRSGGPFLQYQISLQNRPADLAIYGGHAYVVGDFSGIEVFRLPTTGSAQIEGRIETKLHYQKIRILNQRAYLLAPGRIDIFAIGNPENPTLVGFATIPGGNIRDFSIAEDSGVLLTENNQLILLDMRPANSPRVLKTITLPYQALSLKISQGILYVAGGEQGLFAMDISHPEQVAAIGHYQTSGPALDLSIKNHLALLATAENGMTILDVTDPTHIKWVGSHQQLGDVRRIQSLDNERASVVNTNHDLLLLDTSNPAMPSLISGTSQSQAVIASDHYKDTLLLATPDALLQMNIQAIPPQISNEGLDFGQGVNYGGERKLTIHNNIAYVADWFSGIHLYDIREPQRPKLLSSFHTQGSPKGIVVRDGTAFVADDDHGLQIIDVHDPENPRQLSSLLTSGLAYTPVLAGELLYLASHRGGFQIINIKDVSNPILIADVDTPGKSWSIQVQGNYAYVADDESGLLIFDISNPATPQVIAQFNPGGAAEDILIDGDIAYVAFFDQGLYILDISDPTQPRTLRHVSTPGNARGLELDDHYLYVADWLSGIQILDVAQPDSASIIGSYDTEGASWGLRIQNGFAFVADWWGGFVVLDISDPSRPRMAGSYHHNDTVKQISTQGVYAYIAKGRDGLQVFDINNPLNPTWVTGVNTGAAQRLVTSSRFAVVCGDERRVTVVDINNPFQPKPLNTIPIDHHCERLSAAGDQIYISDKRGNISMLDLAQNPFQISRFNRRQKLVDLWVDGNDIYLLMQDGEVQLFNNTLSHTPRTTFYLPKNAAVKFIRAANQLICIYQEGKGITLLSSRAGKIERTGFIPLAAPVSDIQLLDDKLYAVTHDNIIYAFIVEKTGQWQAKTTYQTLNNITRLQLNNNSLYLAGDQHITAINALPVIPLENISENKTLAVLPGNMPSGAYDVVLTQFSQDQNAAAQHNIFYNGLNIVMPTLGKPRFTMDDLKKIMQQRKAEGGAVKP